MAIFTGKTVSYTKHNAVMNLFIKIIRWLFYILIVACIGFFIAYKTSDPVNEDYFRYFLYCGFSAMGLSMIRFILRFMF